MGGAFETVAVISIVPVLVMVAVTGCEVLLEMEKYPTMLYPWNMGGYVCTPYGLA